MAETLTEMQTVGYPPIGGVWGYFLQVQIEFREVFSEVHTKFSFGTGFLCFGGMALLCRFFSQRATFFRIFQDTMHILAINVMNHDTLMPKMRRRAVKSGCLFRECRSDWTSNSNQQCGLDGQTRNGHPSAHCKTFPAYRIVR